jgi:hypothetical protein
MFLELKSPGLDRQTAAEKLGTTSRTSIANEGGVERI